MSDPERRAWVALDRAAHDLTTAEVAQRAKLKDAWRAGCVLRKLQTQGRASSRVTDVGGLLVLVWRAV